jgi:DNA-binding transcriptional MerR regulator
MEQTLLSDIEGAKLAGVTADTINRYGEFGLLKRIVTEGKTYYRRSDVESLFFINEQREEATKTATGVAESRKSDIGHNDLNKDLSAPTADTAMRFESAQVVPDGEPQQGSKLTSSISVEQDYTRDGGNSFELFELNRTLREQIKTLREERDWLRQRLEKAELRAEREQMLLLSESETIRRLVNEPVKKTSWFALPWFKN